MPMFTIYDPCNVVWEHLLAFSKADLCGHRMADQDLSARSDSVVAEHM